MGFWSKIKQRFTGSSAPVEGMSSDGKADAPPSGGNWLAKWRSGGRREQQLQAMQQAFLEIGELMKSIHANLGQQIDVQQKLITVLEQVPPSMQTLQSTLLQQNETLHILRKSIVRAEIARTIRTLVLLICLAAGLYGAWRAGWIVFRVQPSAASSEASGVSTPVAAPMAPTDMDAPVAGGSDEMDEPADISCDLPRA